MSAAGRFRNVERLLVESLDIPDGRARQQVDEAAVLRLMESMSRIGLKTPITTRGISDSGDVILVAGRHRLEAAKRLGWENIDAFVLWDWDEDEARMWEISENLARAELTALERDEHIAEWIKLAEKAKGVLAQVAPKLSARGRCGEGRPESGVRAAARDLGIDRDDARRATKVAGLAPEAKEAARSLGLDDNRSALLQAAKKVTAQEQVVALSERAAPKPPKIAADPLTNELAAERQVARLMDAWNAAGPEARAEFLLRIDTPVFERGAA